MGEAMTDRPRPAWGLQDYLGDLMGKQTASPRTIPAAAPSLEDPDGRGRVTGTCGDTVEIFVKVQDGRVVQACSQIQGCVFTAACAAAASSLIEGKTLAEARRAASPDAIAAVVGELPDDHRHCAELATHSVHEALDSALLGEREPWRKAYRR